MEAGPLIVILTLGAKGVTYASKKGDSGHVTVPTVKVVETTVSIRKTYILIWSLLISQHS